MSRQALPARARKEAEIRAHRRLVRANGVHLCVETLGDAASPALLLVGGMAMSMDWWEDVFCERLAAGPRFVIRYDQRDTGESVSYPPGAPGYTGSDLVADSIGVLDALGVPRAHLIGVSMGGGIVQAAALVFPERVASLTLIAASPAVSDPERPRLPPPSARLAAYFANPPPQPDWSDREAAIDYVVADQREYLGSIPADEAELHALAARIVDRTVSMESSMTNHAAAEEGEPVRGRLGEIDAPTLVLHGTEDPLFPIAHGEALAAEIPGARLLTLEGMGHQVPPRELWDIVVPALLEHTAEGR
jgi:pimeloyl-ACP methyl ester carboxylesterase